MCCFGTDHTYPFTSFYCSATNQQLTLEGDYTLDPVCIKLDEILLTFQEVFKCFTVVKVLTYFIHLIWQNNYSEISTYSFIAVQ